MPAKLDDRHEQNREFDEFVGERIRERRQQHFGWRLVDVAQSVNMDLTQLSRVERGERSLNLREGLALFRALEFDQYEIQELIREAK